MTGKEVADLLGIGADSWRRRVSRHAAPEPDDYDRSVKGTPVNLWRRSTIEQYVRERSKRRGR